MKTAVDVRRLLDRNERLKKLPVRRVPKAGALLYLAGKFDANEAYSERQVNEILDAWHTFGDHTMLRRELCDAGYLRRLPDGTRYWLARDELEFTSDLITDRA